MRLSQGLRWMLWILAQELWGSSEVTARAALGEDNGYCFHPPRGTYPVGMGTASTSKWEMLRRVKELLPELGRVMLCHDAWARGAKSVGVKVKGDSGWITSVMRCGSVWVCPVCARRVSEQRKEDVQGAIDNAIRSGMGVCLVTHTFPHGAGDVLKDILDKFSKAQRASKSGRAAKELHKKYGFVGEIRTLEVTHGVNGWHPHAHSIWITKNPLNQEQQGELRADLYQLWVKACRNPKWLLPDPSPEHGVDVRGARYAGEYVAKWGFATEVAGSTSKRGKKESAGRTPWQLLADSTEGDPRSSWLFREFALAFFGKRQLFWSRGLRDKLKLPPELTEQQAMDLEEEKAELVVVLDLDTWRCVAAARAQEMLIHYAVHERIGLYAFLNHLRSTVPIIGGAPPGPREDWQL